MTQFTLTITGTKPLLMHNSQLSDPLNRWAREMKKLSGKRTKTDEDHLELARLEFFGGLYFDDDLGPVMPSQNLEAAITDGAKRTKQGKNVGRGLFITDLVTPIVYAGPRDLDALWGDGESEYVHRASVKVGTSRVMRTRPIFRQWVLEADGFFDDQIFNLETVEQILTDAGSYAGLGDWRPRFGTFTHTLEVKK